jgi:hypothetical protein
MRRNCNAALIGIPFQVDPAVAVRLLKAVRPVS